MDTLHVDGLQAFVAEADGRAELAVGFFADGARSPLFLPDPLIVAEAPAADPAARARLTILEQLTNTALLYLQVGGRMTDLRDGLAVLEDGLGRDFSIRLTDGGQLATAFSGQQPLVVLAHADARHVLVAPGPNGFTEVFPSLDALEGFLCAAADAAADGGDGD